MPPRRRKAPLATVAEDETLQDTEYQEQEPSFQQPKQVEHPEVLAVLDSLEREVQRRMQNLISMVDDAALALRNEFKVQLLKLPKKVRSMPLKQFRTEFGGDMNAVLLEDINARLRAAQAAAMPPPGTSLRNLRARDPAEPYTAARTTRKRKPAASSATRLEEGLETGPVTRATRSRANAQQGGSTFAEQTPAVSGRPGAPFTPAVPSTSARNPQIGETCYSLRGSPLGVFEAGQGGQQAVLNTPMPGGGSLLVPQAAAPGTVVTIVRRQAAGRGARTKAAELEQAIVITTQDGQQFAVDGEAGLQQVPEDKREEVARQLRALKQLAEAALCK